MSEGYASSLGKQVNMTEGKLIGMKSHNCHVFMKTTSTLFELNFKGGLLVQDELEDAPSHHRKHIKRSSSSL